MRASARARSQINFCGLTFGSRSTYSFILLPVEVEKIKMPKLRAPQPHVRYL